VKGRLFSLLLTVACSGSASDHERLGDTAYEQSDFAAALGEYREASRDQTNGRPWAKLGAAAVKAGAFREAADAYSKLAAVDQTRESEAARGLEQVARAADRADAGPGLEDAVDALRRLAPARVSTRYTSALLRRGHLEPAEAVGFGPLALAAAGDAAAVDEMLVEYGASLQRTTACGDAADAYMAALRRSRDARVRSRAVEGLGTCGVQLGLEALLLERPEVAHQWFARVVAVDSSSERGRRALVGLGDTRVEQGDVLAAAIAYQAAMRHGASDSIIAIASERLGRLGAHAAAADSR
jgi:tetratricopeptide (TPR) repeat protein